jgi:hypothetical protein
MAGFGEDVIVPDSVHQHSTSPQIRSPDRRSTAAPVKQVESDVLSAPPDGCNHRRTTRQQRFSDLRLRHPFGRGVGDAARIAHQVQNAQVQVGCLPQAERESRILGRISDDAGTGDRGRGAINPAVMVGVLGDHREQSGVQPVTGDPGHSPGSSYSGVQFVHPTPVNVAPTAEGLVADGRQEFACEKRGAAAAAYVVAQDVLPQADNLTEDADVRQFAEHALDEGTTAATVSSDEQHPW